MFDLTMLGLQLSLLQGDPRFEKQQRDVRAIAALLEEHAAIPSIQRQMALILEVQTDPFWVDASLAGLEDVRRKLRGLVSLIEKRKRAAVITDFADVVGESSRIPLSGFAAAVDREKVREKAQLFLRKHERDPAIHKLRWNEPLTPEDLPALEAIFAGEGSSPGEIAEVSREGGLGLFVRSLVGLDREAARRALSGFTAGRALTANQIEFTNLIVNHLTKCGWMDRGSCISPPLWTLTRAARMASSATRSSGSWYPCLPP